jgi:hypothetical protein
VPASYTAARVGELIDAINAANLTAEADTITLAAGRTFTLTAVDNTTDGATGLPVITAGEDLTIIGNGATIERSTATGTPAFRLSRVESGAAITLEHLTLQGGLTDWSGKGGAVLNAGSLKLEDVVVQQNTAQGYAGFSVWGSPNYPGGDAWGGGVYSDGSLTMQGCTIRNNVARGGRGGDGFRDPFGEPGVGGGILPPSDGGNAYGGGLYVGGGTATIKASIVIENTAQGGEGGVPYGGFGKSGKSGHGVGGGIFIAAEASVGLDAFTKQNVKNNSASTKRDIAGSYTLLR